MDKTKLVRNFKGPDERLSFSKVLDRALLCEKRGCPTFSGFLDPKSALEFQQIFEKESSCSVMAYGGAMGCERLMLGFFSEYDRPLESEFPIEALEIAYDNDKLNHRDFLGAILGTGVTRERVGDIFVFPGKAIAFLEQEIAGFVLSTLISVGKASVNLKIIEDDFLIAPFTEGVSRDLVVSSMRLDAVVAAAFNLSRGKAAKFIEGEKVFVNWQAVKSLSKPIAEGDIITLRGSGRAKIESVNGKTKKDNISISVSINGAGNLNALIPTSKEKRK